MNVQLDTIKNKIQAHPAETVAVVATISTIAVVLYYRKKYSSMKFVDFNAASKAVKDGGVLLYQVDGVDYSFRLANI